jgi:hypothetical protein
MSRGTARQQITLAQHREATAHVECRKDSGVLDESPAAYKSIDDVMAAQLDLVEVVHTLRQVLCVKGNGAVPAKAGLYQSSTSRRGSDRFLRRDLTPAFSAARCLRPPAHGARRCPRARLRPWPG